MSKAETIRRLILGDLRKIFRHRYGPTLPDDDAGREDLELLLRLISLSPREGEERMQFQIETLAPWMPETEAADLINNLLRLDLRLRRLSGKEAGKQVQLTNAERERLRAWSIAPVDITAIGSGAGNPHNCETNSDCTGGAGCSVCWAGVCGKR